jgi:membrane protein DedA with SNARE-associated domain
MDWIHALWGVFVDHLYVAVFLATVVDATGIPFPGRLLLIAAGATAASGGSVGGLVLLGAAGAVLGDHLWYVAGRTGGERLLRFVCRLTLMSTDCRERAQAYARRFGAFTLFLARFSTAVRVFSAVLAASGKVGYLRFLVLDLAAALLWSSLWILIGYGVGSRYPAIGEHAGVFQLGMTTMVLVSVGGFVLLRLRARRSHPPRAPLPEAGPLRPG